MLKRIEKIHDIDCWFFDNDGTLYNCTREFEDSVIILMDQFIADHFKINLPEARLLRLSICKKYNLPTVLALRKEGIDDNEFTAKTYLKANLREFDVVEDEKLKILIKNLRGEKFVLTNNPSSFARLILISLGVEDLFSEIIGIQESQYCLKPNSATYKPIREKIKSGRKVAFADDKIENLIPAKKLGCLTILVENEKVNKAQKLFIDYQLLKLTDS